MKLKENQDSKILVHIYGVFKLYRKHIFCSFLQHFGCLTSNGIHEHFLGQK